MKKAPVWSTFITQVPALVSLTGTRGPEFLTLVFGTKGGVSPTLFKREGTSSNPRLNKLLHPKGSNKKE